MKKLLAILLACLMVLGMFAACGTEKPEEAIKRIRRTGVDKETIYTCYVTDSSRKLLGLVSVKDLLLAADDETPIREIMTTNVIYASTSTDQEEVARMLSKYNFLAMPVLDSESRMVGIVTFDDAMDVMEEEATEDIEMMAGMTPSEKPYLKSTPFELFKNRFPWLSMMMGSATFTARRRLKQNSSGVPR